MSDPLAVDLARGGWLTLVVMMLVSRVLFQRAGPVEMRRFLSEWTRSRTKRVWGGIALLYAALVVIAYLVAEPDRLDAADWLVGASLVAVLVIDGSVNVLPEGFATFKDSVQRKWVERTGQRRGEADAPMFATINAVLAAASVLAGAAVLLYAEFSPWLPIVAVLLGVGFTLVLLWAADRERDRS